jgi:protein CpxP
MRRPGANPRAGSGDNTKEDDDVKSMSDRTAHAAAGAMSILVLLSVSAGPVAGASRNADASGQPASGLMAQAAPAPAMPGAASPAPQTPGQPMPPDGPVARVEVRISELHKQFHITPAQEAQFTAYADVMRSNAQAMQALFQERAQSPDTTAITQLRWYTRLTTAHGEALTKLVPVFETLYQSLSDQQKKATDKVFEQIRQRRSARQAG